MTSAPELRPGTALAGRYVLDARIGSGGAGSVWRAHDEVLGRWVAVKVLLPQLGDDPAAAARFRAEATSAARLTHPNAVVVFDIGRDGGLDYLVMELVDGPDLTALLRSRPLAPGVVAYLGRAIGAALGAAHGNGLVHRDVKPGNVLLTPAGVPKVADFGIARAIGDAMSRLTQPGSVMGTARYVAPEQLRDEAVDARADVYALGLVLHEALTGRAPWGDGAATEVAMRRLARDLPPVSASRDDVPPGLDAVVARATRLDPADRQEDGAELASALAPFTAPDAQASLAALVRQLPPPATPAPAEGGRTSDARSPAPDRLPPGSTMHGGPPMAPPSAPPPGNGDAGRGQRPPPGAEAGDRTHVIGSGPPAAPRPDASDAHGTTALGRAATPAAPPPPSHRTPTSPAHQPSTSPTGQRPIGPAPGSPTSPTHRSDGTSAPPAGIDGPATTGRSRRRRRWVLVLIAVAVAGTVGVLGMLDGSVPTSMPTTSGTLRDVPISGAGDHDPLGDGGENPDRLADAHDGDASTSWQTEGYDRTDLIPPRKDGVGIWFDLGDGHDVRRMEIDLVTAGSSFEVWVGDEPPGAEQRPEEWGAQVAAVEDAGQREDVRFDDAEGQVVLVWFTTLPPDGDRHRARVADVRIQAR